MIKFEVITLFPEIIRAYCGESILKRAAKRRLIAFSIHDLRDFAPGRHRKADDRPYGGGPGMVIRAEPLARAFTAISSRIGVPNKRARRETKVILLSPAGKQFSAALARAWARKYKHLIFIAGHYEGIDARLGPIVKDAGFLVAEVSIGPYVLTGGELAALVMVDAIARQIPGVLGTGESREEARYGVGVPAYTRPEKFRFHGKTYRVPRVLMGGNHAAIEAWRRAHARKSSSMAA